MYSRRKYCVILSVSITWVRLMTTPSQAWYPLASIDITITIAMVVLKKNGMKI